MDHTARFFLAKSAFIVSSSISRARERAKSAVLLLRPKSPIRTYSAG